MTSATEEKTADQALDIWNHLPPGMQRAAAQTWKLGWIRSASIGETRAAQLAHGALALDPLAAMKTPEIWKLAKQHIPSPAYHAWRIRQVLANGQVLRMLEQQGKPGFGLDAGQFAGTPAYIVGNGPSAHAAREVIPRRDDRRGLVFAVNGAAKLFDGDLDFWCVGDALWPKGNLAWWHKVLGEWGSVDYSGSQAIASIYTSADALDLFRLAGGGAVHFYHGLHENPYRPLITEGQQLPNFVEGLQAVVSHINAAFFLGCSPIILCGLDQCFRPDEGGLHASGDAGWRPDVGAEWIEVTDVIGRKSLTMPDMVAAANHVAALAMWIQDAGTPILSASEGVDYVFAPFIQAREIIEKIESDS